MKSRPTFWIATLSLSAFAGIGHASLIFLENFNTVTDGLAKTGAVGNFTVTMGNVDVVGTHNSNLYSYLCVSPESVNCVDLDGNTKGQISTSSISLSPGTYTLTFDLNGSRRGNSTSTTVSFASFSHTYVLGSGDLNTFTIQISVTTAGSSTLVFTSNTAGAAGALLDDVSINFTPNSPPPTVPEPTTGLAMISSLGLVVTARRRIFGKAR